MKSSWIRATAAASLVIATGGWGAGAAPVPHRFAKELYRALPRQGNLFCSPLSISMALQMVEAGARGETLKQMATALASASDPTPRQELEGLTKANSAFQLTLANRIWSDQGTHFLPAFLQTLETNFGASCQAVDFAGSGRQIINDWVAKITHELIKDLLPAGSVNSSTRMVLTNAIYFKGSWVHRFELGAPGAPQSFQAPDGPQKAIFMHQRGTLPAYFGSDVEVVELPYKGDRLSMLVVMPTRSEAPLPDTSGLEGWLEQMSPCPVDVYLPKFKLSESYTLNDTLIAMGMPALFDAQADFSGMDGQRDLHVSLVVHKAYVDVNEEGTEAAAATGVIMTRSAVIQQVQRFRADRPFLFLIRDNDSGQILFLGRLNKPD